MKHCAYALFSILFMVILGACTEEMENQSQISKFRIMGLQAHPPEVAPGGTVDLEALFAVPENKPTDVLWIVLTGELNPSSIGQETDLEFAWPPAQGTIDEDGVARYGPSLAVPPDYLEDLPPDEEGWKTLDITVILLACAGGALNTDFESLLSSDTVDAFSDLCTGASPEMITSFKTFTITDKQPENDTDSSPIGALNENPSIWELEFDEKTHLPGAPAGETGSYICEGSDGCRDSVNIRVKLSLESFQFYRKYTNELTNDLDSMYISWYTDGGEMSADRSGSESAEAARSATTLEKYNQVLEDDSPHWFNVEWRPPIEGGTYRFWVVAHDLRGGVSWQQYQIQATWEQDTD